MATETITQTNLPAPFLQTMGQTFGEGLMQLGQKPVPTTGFQPTVAGMGAVGQAGQQAAAAQAGLGALQFDPTTGQVTGMGQGTGIAGYQPYLGAAGALTGTGAGAATQAGSTASYMSPYTTNVIQAMRDQMADVKAQQDIGRNAQAVGAGAFGGARQGVQQSVADTEYNRMIGQMVAQQTGQAYGQAQSARQQDYMNQMGLAQAQPQLAQQNIQGIMGLGQQEQAYRQTMADTYAQQQKLKEYEPYQRYGFMGEQITGLMGGYPGGTRMTTQPTASPMQQALGMGIMGGLGYAGMKTAGMMG
jgi:hypothetical protein